MRHLCCLWQQFRQNLALARHADEDVSRRHYFAFSEHLFNGSPG
jgi:hypothetical protein